MPLDVNAKAFVPNFSAKPFVPGTAAAGATASTAPQNLGAANQVAAAPPAPVMRTGAFFRYTIHTPTPSFTAATPLSPTKDDPAPIPQPNPLFSMSSMQTKGCLRSNASGGPNVEAMSEFTLNYFSSLERPTDPTRVGFVSSTDLIGPLTHPLDVSPGFLLPLIVPSTPTAEHFRAMGASFHQIVYELQHNTDVRAMGHISRTWKQDEGGPVSAHYFFVAVNGSELPARLGDVLFESVTIARQVIRVPNVMALVMDARRIVATLHLSLSPMTKLVEPYSSCPSTQLVYVPPTLDTIGDIHPALERVVAGAERTRHVILSVACNRTFSTADAFRLLVRECWDYMVIPVAVTMDESISTAYAASISLPVMWHAAPPGVVAMHCWAPRCIKSDVECVSVMKHLSNTVADNIGNVVKHSEFTAALPVRIRAGSPFVAPCFIPVEDLNSYLGVRDLVTQSQHIAETLPDDNGDTSKAKRLRKSIFREAAQNVAREAYRLRRNPAGERVLVVVDAFQNVFLVDATTMQWVTALPGWRGSSNSPLVWSGFLNGANCVLEGTLTQSFRGENQFKVIVHDVLMWNQQLLGGMTLPQRMQEIDHPGLECETSWAAPAPLGIVVLRVSYSPVNKGPQLLNAAMTQAEHPTLGITFVPCTTTKKGSATERVPAYTWTPPESRCVRFLVLQDTDVSDECSSTFKVRRAALACRGTTYGPQESLMVPYCGEYADYLTSTVSNLSKFSTIQCLLQREPDGAHWWEIIRVCAPTEHLRADSKATVDAIVHDPCATLDDVTWLCNVSDYLCMECSEVDDLGAEDTSVQKYYCRKCWESYGYGECKQCGVPFTQGSLDQATHSFYCKPCWATFHAAPSTAAANFAETRGVSRVELPPCSPTNSVASAQGAICNTLCSLQDWLIGVAARCGATAHVLDMCCGPGLSLRRWVEVGCTSYLGVDLTSSVLAVARQRAQTLTQQLQSSHPSNSKPVPRMDFVCADCFHPDFWKHHVAKAHAAQFSVISSRKGLKPYADGENGHHTATSADVVDTTLKGVATALVPNGIFVGLVLEQSALVEFMSDKSESVYVEPDTFTVETTKSSDGERSYTVKVVGEAFPWGATDIGKLIHLGEKHDLRTVAEFLPISDSNKALPPTALECLHAVGNAITSTLSPAEKRLMSFYRLLVLRKGARAAPTTEPGRSSNLRADD